MTTSRDTTRKFQFLREIASGGFGSVFLTKVIHPDGFSRLVALKLLHKRWSENVEVASRMRDEARLLGWLRHRHIVEVLDLTTIDGRSAVIMEYLEAIDARSLVDRTAATGGTVPVPVVMEIGAACASALDAAYNRSPYAGEKPLRVIHRDIKPSNLMVDAHGIVKVLDFGVARAEFDSREAKTAELSFGSLEYMPPERLFFEPESPASDIYSLGSTLYELLALEKLGKAKLRQSEQDRWISARLEALIAKRTIEPPALARELEGVLRKMLAFDESDRPTASDLVGQFRALGRQSPEPSMEEWSGNHVLQLVDVVRAQHEQGQEASTLMGQTVSEDPPSVRGDMGLRREEETTGVQTEQFQPFDVEGPESAEYTTSSGHDDARWSALKEATLASLNETGELRRSAVPAGAKAPSGRTSASASLPPGRQGTPPGARTAQARPPEPSPAAPNAGDWIDEPTVIPPGIAPTERLAKGPTLPPTFGAGSSPPLPLMPAHQSFDGGPEDETVIAPPPPPPPSAPRPARSTPVSRPAEVARDPEPPPEPAGAAMSVLAGVAVLGAVGLGTFLVVVLAGSLAVVFVSSSQPTPTPRPAPDLVEISRPPDPAPAPPPAPAPEVAPAPVPEVPPAPVPEVAPVAPEPAPVAEGLSFVSKLPDTRKMTVRCDVGAGSGVDRVAIAEPATECTVVALDGARNRRTAVVKGVTAKAYECFASDDTCR